MSIESDAATAADGDGVDALARELGDAIRETPEYQAFEERKAAVEADDDLQEQIQQFEQQRQEFMLARQTSEATQEDLVELQQAQQELNDNPVMAEYLDAKETLQDRLETVNELVSEPLAVDFGGEAGGCCHD
jgi:cell fate (sporulation/competence/biofilm development) regulator YlbF (YheA/YmcA/DUF963 family)